MRGSTLIAKNIATFLSLFPYVKWFCLFAPYIRFTAKERTLFNTISDATCLYGFYFNGNKRFCQTF